MIAKTDRALGFLRTVSLIAVGAGSGGAVALLLRAGRNTPGFLLVLMAVWVLSPFAAFAWAGSVSRRWSARTRATLHLVTFVVALGSLPFYAGLVSKPAGAPFGFYFVLVPPASVALVAITVAIAALISRAQNTARG